MVPLAIFWLARDPFAKTQAREALHAQISCTVDAIVCLLLFRVAVGSVLLFVLWAMVSAALAVSKGEEYRHPWTFRPVSRLVSEPG